MYKINNDEIKVIISDYDGTLHGFYNPEVPNINIDEINKAIKAGVYFVMNTGNLPYEMREIVQKFGAINDKNCYLICANGNAIHDYRDNSHQIKTWFDRVTTLKFIEIFKEHNLVSYDIAAKDLDKNYYNDVSIINKYIQFPMEKDWSSHRLPLLQAVLDDLTICPKITLKRVPLFQKTSIIKAIKDNFPNLDIKATWFMDSGVDFSINGANKFTAIVDFLNLLNNQGMNITLDNVVYFGDNHNDLDAFLNLKYAIAVENAIDEIKDHAYAITDNAADGGVGKYLQKIYKEDTNEKSNT